MMKISQTGINLIKQYEGCRHHPYQDSVGLWTVGYGHLLGDGHTLSDTDNRTFTDEELDEFLRSDIARFEHGVSTYCTVLLTQGQFDALVCFAYNLGLGTLQRSTLRTKLNASDYDGASQEFLKYTKAGGVVLKGLVARRQAEYQLFTRIDPITDTSTSDT